jgi:putative oxidoreductase
VDVGMLILRVVVGLTMAAHGAQGLFGWFGGPGFAGTATFLEQMGFRPGELHSALAGGSQFAGGLLLALGLITPLGTAAVAGSMVGAIATVHWPNGFFLSNNGFEYNLVLIASSLAIGFAGPGRFSVDRLCGLTLSGARWGTAAAALAVVTAAGVVAVRGEPAPAPVPQSQGAITAPQAESAPGRHMALVSSSRPVRPPGGGHARNPERRPLLARGS